MMKALGILWRLGTLALSRVLHGLQPRNPARPPRRILVLGYGAVGDVIFFLPALRALRCVFPKAAIVFMANRYPTIDELLPAAGLADEIWPAEATNWDEEYRDEILSRIREGRFDAVVLSLPAPARYFAPALLGIPIRVGHCRPIEAPHAGWSAPRYLLWRLRRGLISEEFERRILLNRKIWVRVDDEHIVARNLRLAEALGAKATPEDLAPPSIPEPEKARAAAEKALKGIDKPIGLHLGSPASQYGKIWPAGCWAEVCSALGVKGLVLLGGSEERQAAERFSAEFKGGAVDLIGRCDILETFAVIKRCSLFLSSDTGLAKAAMALGVPTVTVWGPSDRPGWGVLWNKEKHLEVFRPMSCSPCVRMGLRNEGAGVINYATCGHRACLAELSPKDVALAVRQRYGAELGF